MRLEKNSRILKHRIKRQSSYLKIIPTVKLQFCRQRRQEVTKHFCSLIEDKFAQYLDVLTFGDIVGRTIKSKSTKVLKLMVILYGPV